MPLKITTMKWFGSSGYFGKGNKKARTAKVIRSILAYDNSMYI